VIWVIWVITAPQRQETPEASVQEGFDKAQAHSDGARKCRAVIAILAIKRQYSWIRWPAQRSVMGMCLKNQNAPVELR